MSQSAGIFDRRIAETPIAIIDFETTGLTPGADRVVEVSVVRIDPGASPKLVLDTLVNPMRPMAATEIHGITDEDVAGAPSFPDVAGELLLALSDSVVAAYNVYFDIKFLGFELGNVGVLHQPPHFCLMYLRPMLGIGTRCRLGEACCAAGVSHDDAHVASGDALASGELFLRYMEHAHSKGIETFADLAALKKYKFVKSFENAPLAGPDSFNLQGCDRLCSRTGLGRKELVDPTRQALASYWDSLCTVVADLEITEDELEHVIGERKRLGLSKEQIRSSHARAFASVISQFTSDRWLDDREVRQLRRLRECLSRLGWAPGD